MPGQVCAWLRGITELGDLHRSQGWAPTQQVSAGCPSLQQGFPQGFAVSPLQQTWPLCRVTVNNTPGHSLPLRDLFLIFICISVVPQAVNTMDGWFPVLRTKCISLETKPL